MIPISKGLLFTLVIRRTTCYAQPPLFWKTDLDKVLLEGNIRTVIITGTAAQNRAGNQETDHPDQQSPDQLSLSRGKRGKACFFSAFRATRTKEYI